MHNYNSIKVDTLIFYALYSHVHIRVQCNVQTCIKRTSFDFIMLHEYRRPDLGIQPDRCYHSGTQIIHFQT